MDCRFGVWDPDVDMEAEGRLATGELAHRAVDELVTLAGGDDDLLPDSEGVVPALAARIESGRKVPSSSARSEASSSIASPMRAWTPVWISSAEPWVSAVKLAVLPCGRRGRTLSMRWARAQVSWSSSITSSSIPTV